MNVIRLYHFHNGFRGGVLSVISNLIRHQQNPYIENHVIYTINKEQIPAFELPGLKGAASERIFYLSPNWNFYYTCRKLSKLLPDEKAIIVAHDWLELGMVSNLGLSNPVIHMIHGNYNYYHNLALLHEKNIDLFFCVSPTIARKLAENLDKEKIIDWRVPVAKTKDTVPYKKDLHILFIAANLFDANKNLLILPKIDALLSRQNIFVHWHLVGDISDNKINHNAIWSINTLKRVKYYGFLNDKQREKCVLQCNAMILPSFQEGLPLSVVECMKKGLVPFISFLNGALEDLVVEGETGFYADPNEAQEFCEKITLFYNDFRLRKKMIKQVKIKADEIFDPFVSVKIFEQESSNLKPKRRFKFKAYGSRLDKELIPNLIVKTIRDFKR